MILPVYYRLPRFKSLLDEIDGMELSDEVKLKLVLARLKALKKHKEIYFNNVA